MKTRLLTAAVGVPIILAVVLIAPVWVFGAVLGFMSSMAAVELLRCAVPGTCKRIYVSAMIIAFFLPISFSLGFQIRWSIWFILLIFFLFSMEMVISFHKEDRVTLEMLAIAMLASVILPMMLGTLARMGYDSGRVGRATMLLPFICTIFCDSGAYFVGRACGKHKLAPLVSPKKTVEGGIGGLACSVLMCFVYGRILISFGYQINSLSFLIYGLLGGFVSQLGDLTFSAIKRQYGIKDYGKALPGHGGILDRFDSMYYLAPLTEFWMLVMPAIWL